MISTLLVLGTIGTTYAKTCKNSVKGMNISQSEAQATKSALAIWSSNAKRKFGAAYADWNKAEEREIKCKASTLAKKQGQQCIAIAKPCDG